MRACRCGLAQLFLPRQKVGIARELVLVVLPLHRVLGGAKHFEAVHGLGARVHKLRHGLNRLHELAVFGLVHVHVRGLLLPNGLVEHGLDALDVGRVLNLLHHDAHARLGLHQRGDLPPNGLAAQKVGALLVQRLVDDLVALLALEECVGLAALFRELDLDFVEVFAEIGEGLLAAHRGVARGAPAPPHPVARPPRVVAEHKHAVAEHAFGIVVGQGFGSCILLVKSKNVVAGHSRSGVENSQSFVLAINIGKVLLWHELGTDTSQALSASLILVTKTMKIINLSCQNKLQLQRGQGSESTLSG